MSTLPVVPAETPEALAAQLSALLDAVSSGVDVDPSPFFDAAIRDLVGEIAAGHLRGIEGWKLAFGALVHRAERDLPIDGDPYHAMLARTLHLGALLREADVALRPARVREALRSPERWVQRMVLLAVDQGEGRYLGCKDVVDRLVYPQGEATLSSRRVSQVLAELQVDGLLRAIPLAGRGGTHPHYALSMAGREVVASLPAKLAAQPDVVPFPEPRAGPSSGWVPAAQREHVLRPRVEAHG